MYARAHSFMHLTFTRRMLSPRVPTKIERVERGVEGAVITVKVIILEQAARVYIVYFLMSTVIFK